MESEFTVTFALDGGSAAPDELVERLGAAGCNDALVGIGRPGHIALHCIRDACSASEAVISAIRDVQAAIPEAEFIEVTRESHG